MWILVIVAVIVVFALFPYLRFCLFHPVTTVKYAVRDIYDKVKYKRYNECKDYGKIKMFSAADSQSFGSGKTLSLVRYVRNLYHTYNNKLVWNDEKQEFIHQHIIVISNVVFKDIPYIPFVGKSQFVNLDGIEHTENDILLFVIDEAGMEFNSRQYKDNLPTDFLVRLLQVRHNKVSFVMTSQRFTFVDKILRNTTEVVTTCKKKWRIVRLQDFDAYELENSGNPRLIVPLCTRWYFATNKLYKSYDTTYNVQKLKDSLQDGDILDTSEILARISSDGVPDRAKPSYRKKYREKR